MAFYPVSTTRLVIKNKSFQVTSTLGAGLPTVRIAFKTWTLLFGYHAVEKLQTVTITSHNRGLDTTSNRWKQIGVNKIFDSHEPPFVNQWLTTDHPSKDGISIAKVKRIMITSSDPLSDSWFKSEIPGGLNGADIEGNLVKVLRSGVERE